MTSIQVRENQLVDPMSAERFELRLRFRAAAEASCYLRALTSLLTGASTKVIATLPTGVSLEDLTTEEIADRLARGALSKLGFALPLGDHRPLVEAEILATEPAAVVLRAPFTSGPATSRLWLQSDADVLAPVAALALSTATEGFAVDAAHALVGLATRCGAFEEAELTGELRISWSTTKSSDDAKPVRSTLHDAVWSTANSDGVAELWVTGLAAPAKPRTPAPDWWEQYEVLTRGPREVLTELHAHLAVHFDIPFAWAITDKNGAPAGTFVVQPEASTIARLVPEVDRVVVAVDLEQPSTLVAETLLHLCAHLMLGHVRPGDAWGHWDTPGSLSPTPHRQWDRETRAFVDEHFARPVRRVSSLEECNPREKAWLVLLVLERNEWKTVLRELSASAGHTVSKEEVLDLIGRIAVVSGETEGRETVIHAFAPFYRLGPSRPSLPDTPMPEQWALEEQWTTGWTQALTQPIDVLFATDVLAEGVNLQDAALLINFDVHWNPVRMIQRAGRIDRRLNPAIEEATSFPDLEALASNLGVEPPRYWWHAHTGAAPVTVNLLLPDELEAELQLRERIANKTLAIDFTLGLEQGTGAEADWMTDYRYQGISALNAWQGDRAIEQIAGYQQRLRRLMSERGIDAEWLTVWNGWLREVGGRENDPILAWAQLGRKGGETTVYTRQLQPRLLDGIPHWLWTTTKPADSLLNFWLALDSKTFPAATRTGFAFSEDSSRPIVAEDLLVVSRRLVDENTALEEMGDVRRPLLQGASAISAGFFDAEPDRRAIAVSGFRLLQLRRIDEAASVTLSEKAC